MDKLLLFIDGSVKENIGYGAYLSVPEHKLHLMPMETNVQLKRFEKTSSTKLELQTLIWSLEENPGIGPPFFLFCGIS